MPRRTPTAVATTAEPLESRRLFAVTTFTIDPVLSSLRLSGEVAGEFDIEAQRTGSLLQNYQGTIVADVNPAVISFPGRSSIVAQAQREYDPGDGPANYGVEGETGGPFSIKIGEGAIRNFAFDLRAGDLALSDTGAFAANGLEVRTTNGVFEFDLRVGGDGETDIDDERDGNDASGNATLRGDGENRTLTIPLDFTLDVGSTDLRFRGTLVAKTGAGAPIDPNVVRIGDGTLLKSVQFTDADGTLTTVTMTGGGSADVRFANAGQQAPGKRGAVVVSGSGVEFLGVDASGTTSTTKLAITAKGGADGVVSVPSIVSDGSISSIGGKGAVFAGNVTVAGALGTLTATRLSSATVTADSIGVVKVSGDVITSRVSATSGAIRSFKSASITGSEIYAGVNDGAARFPATGEVSASGSIATLTTKNFANSVIAADTLGRLKLGTVATGNSGTSFGLTADTIVALQAADPSRDRLRLLLVETPEILDAQLDFQSFDDGDFAIRVG